MSSPARLTRLALLPSLLILALTGCGGGAENSPPSEIPGPTATTAPTSTPDPDEDAPQACVTTELSGSVESVEGAAGSTGFVLALANEGAEACTLQGWPGVSLVGNGDGTQWGPAAEYDRTTFPHDTVTLEPGDAGYVPVLVSNALAHANADCHPRDADGFRVYPPGETEALFIATEGVVACSTDIALITASAVQATPTP